MSLRLRIYIKCAFSYTISILHAIASYRPLLDRTDERYHQSPTFTHITATYVLLLRNL